MFCKYCGKSLDDDAAFCPNCGKNLRESAAPHTPDPFDGTPIRNQPDNYDNRNYRYSQPASKENTIAVVGFIFSFLIAIVGLVCSIIGYRKAVNEGAGYKNLALAGIIISALSMVFSFIIYFCIGFEMALLGAYSLLL